MKTRKSFRPGCLSIALILILLSMMAGLLGLTAQLPRQVYTPEEQAWLSSNSQRVVRQAAPEMNYTLPLAAAKPMAFGAQESHITADMEVRYKEKDGATVTAYDLRFAAVYVIANPDAQQSIAVEMNFPFPQTAAVLSEVTLTVDGDEPAGVTYSMQGVHWMAMLAPGQERKIEVRYRAEGVGSFGYSVPQSQRMKDLDLRVTIRGAREINVPESALEPTARQDTAQETTLAWRYLNTLTHRNVQVELPARPRLAFAQRVEKLGPFFMQLAAAAPLLTLLFLALWLALVKIEALQVTHAQTVLMGIGFFMFYPLFIFLAGFVELSLAFAIALIVAGALVVGYGVRMLGGKRVTVYLVPALMVFYGLLTRGLTEPRYLGLMLVISSVVLVALFMWRASRRRPGPAPVEAAQPVVPMDAATSSAPAEPTHTPESQQEAGPEPVQHESERYCIYCGQRTEDGFRFCPQCGQNAQTTRKCAGCGLEYIPTGDAPSFCPACGRKQ